MNRTDELYHYGVMGMKWGVRKKGYNKYVAKAENFERKAAETSSKHKHFVYSDKAKDYRYMADTSKRMQNSKGLIGREIAKFGADSKIGRIKNKADKWADRGENRRFKITRASAKKQESIARRSQKVFDAYANTPIRTLGGRMQTYDQRKKEQIVSGILGVIGGAPVETAANLYYEFKGYRKNNK